MSRKLVRRKRVVHDHAAGPTEVHPGVTYFPATDWVQAHYLVRRTKGPLAGTLVGTYNNERSARQAATRLS